MKRKAGRLAIPAPDGRAWRVEYRARALRVVRAYGGDDRSFRPTIAALIAQLKHDPKQFPKKHGRLDGIRAAPLRYRGTAWRMTFVLDEAARVVTVLTIDRHDNAYRDASR